MKPVYAAYIQSNVFADAACTVAVGSLAGSNGGSAMDCDTPAPSAYAYDPSLGLYRVGNPYEGPMYLKLDDGSCSTYTVRWPMHLLGEKIDATLPSVRYVRDP